MTDVLRTWWANSNREARKIQKTEGLDEQRASVKVQPGMGRGEGRKGFGPDSRAICVAGPLGSISTNLQCLEGGAGPPMIKVWGAWEAGKGQKNEARTIHDPV